MEKIKEVIRKCPICNNEKAVTLHHQAFAKFNQSPITTSYDIVSCLKCGFVYADTESLQADYDKYYEYMSKYQDVCATGSGSNSNDINRLKASVKTISKYVCDKEADILDIGCANGGLLNELKREGYSCLEGLDPAPQCVEHTQIKGIKAQIGTIFNNKLNQKYDCIILTHVLEHIRDFNKAIEIFDKLLNDNGIIYIELPNATQYTECYTVPYYYFDCEHINHFDVISLQNALKNMECIHIEELLQPVDNGLEYPVLRAVFQKNSISCKEVHYSQKGKQSIQQYIVQSEQDNRVEIIEGLIKKQSTVIVWGAGQYALRLLGTTRLKECNIIAFIDNDSNKQGKSINGIQINSKNTLYNFDGIIVVASALASESIELEIKSMGVKNEIVIL